jgi:hypothetical protein
MYSGWVPLEPVADVTIHVSAQGQMWLTGYDFGRRHDHKIAWRGPGSRARDFYDVVGEDSLSAPDRGAFASVHVAAVAVFATAPFTDGGLAAS